MVVDHKPVFGGDLCGLLKIILHLLIVAVHEIDLEPFHAQLCIF